MLPHFKLRSAADQFFWQSKIDNLKSKIVKAGTVSSIGRAADS